MTRRLRLYAAGATALAALTTGLTMALAPAPASAATDAELATHWAPVHHQDTDSSNYDADYLSRINYDAEWDTLNNWEHQDDSLSWLTGRAYYSVVETSTHWFIVYAFYHPRDWTELCSDASCHENDMEGLLLTVRKNGTTYGKLEAAVTVAHTNFYSYVPAGSSFVAGRETVDGTLRTETYNSTAHPSTFQEAKGHGLYGWNGNGFPGGDGVIYKPSGSPEVPSGGNDSSVGYGLTNIFGSGGMWERRNDSRTYASWGTFRGDNYKDNAANAPWGWDDSDDGSDLPRGLLATDPAKLVLAYFDGTSTFSTTYLRNGYR